MKSDREKIKYYLSITFRGDVRIAIIYILNSGESIQYLSYRTYASFIGSLYLYAHHTNIDSLRDYYCSLNKVHKL